MYDKKNGEFIIIWNLLYMFEPGKSKIMGYDSGTFSWPDPLATQ